MTRIPTIQQRADLTPEHRDVWDTIDGSRGHVAGPFPVLLHSPRVARLTADLGAYLRFESALDPRVRELAIIAAARELECRYEWAAHVREARRAGVREETILAVRDGDAPAGLAAEEAMIVEYVQQLLRRRRVEDPVFRAMHERFGPAGLVELTATVGYYMMLACTLNAFDVMPAPGDDLLPG